MTSSTVTRLLTEAVIFIVAIGKVLETFREQAASAPRLAKSSSKGAAHKSVRSDFSVLLTLSLSICIHQLLEDRSPQ